ncbi:hypothetical protein PybrP1_000995 [[Pythium] brassicae (nom. inval.)]|nr:hypothetical protein PybrP1_000995 [[Pythium] brassicae (nom. inval.)]
MADRKAPPPLLRSPWLSHELFAATKRVASAPDSVARAKRSALAKVAQELRRGRAHVDAQLLELEAQLLGVSDFLSGTRTTLFTDRGLPETVEVFAPAVVAPAFGASGDGGGTAGDDAPPTSPNSAGLRSKFVQHSFPAVSASGKAPAAYAAGTAVEDDLAADTPCTTVGLWKYAAAYDIFRGVTPQDVEASLQLEEVPSVSDSDASEELDGAVYTPSSDSKRRMAAQALGARDGSAADDFLKARLIAALLSVPKQRAGGDACSPPPAAELSLTKLANGAVKEEELEKKKSRAETKAPVSAVGDWRASGVSDALRGVGLVECSDTTLRKRLRDPADDEVSCELRELKALLRDQVHETNEAKRVLRKLLHTSKPWLSQHEEANEAIEKDYQRMWQQKQRR